VKNSLTDSGIVLGLYISREGSSHRENQDEIEVDENGVLGDKFYGKDVDRSILLTAISSYQMASLKNINMTHGAMGENILIDFTPYEYPAGTKLLVGNVILEINKKCSLCKSLTKIDPRVPKLLKNDRGVFVKVIKGGTICLGDKVQAYL
jgi:MOSC domain-containing protein YiiM